MYIYQEKNRYFAQIADGLEELGAEELLELGATDIRTVYRGLHFQADQDALYRINYTSRLITRVLAPLLSFKCHDTDYLYKRTREINWLDFLDESQTFAVFANVSNSHINHSQFAALRVKDAVVDFFRDDCGKRPSIDTESPHVWFNVFIEQNQATISVDCSGGSLHKRGYRQSTVEAPMQETLAAAIIRITEWDGERPLYDPMCGSGTLLSEAALKLSRTPSAWQRKHFGFKALPDYEFKIWKKR